MRDIYSKISLALTGIGSVCFLSIDYSWRNADSISPILAAKLASLLSAVTPPSEPSFSSPGGFGEVEARILFWAIALILLFSALVLAQISVKKIEQLQLSSAAIMLSGAAFMFVHLLVGVFVIAVSIVLALTLRSRLTSQSSLQPTAAGTPQSGAPN